MQKLSEPQMYMLSQAVDKQRKDAIYHNPQSGWFMPNRYETAAVFGTAATAASLCGKGLLEYRTVSYLRCRGVYRAINEYRVTDKGRETLQDAERIA